MAANIPRQLPQIYQPIFFLLGNMSINQEKCKVQKLNVNIECLKKEMKIRYDIEKCIAFGYGKVNKFMKDWVKKTTIYKIICNRC